MVDNQSFAKTLNFRDFFGPQNIFSQIFALFESCCQENSSLVGHISINHRGFLKNNSKYIDRSSHFFASFLYGDISNVLHGKVQKELFDVSVVSERIRMLDLFFMRTCEYE